MPELGWELLSPADKDRLLHDMQAGPASMSPRSIQIDWTDRCNVACFFCSQAGVREGRELNLKVLDRLFAEMEALGARTLQVAGGGDPLFHRDIGAILESIIRRPFRIGTITTNGVLADEHLADQLLEVTRQQLTISLNTVGEEAWAVSMRSPARNYNRVLANIERLVAKKRERGSGPVLALQFLVDGESWRRFDEMIDLADRLGVDRVGFNPLFGFESRTAAIRENLGSFLEAIENLFRADRREIIADVRTTDPEINAAIVAIRERIAPDRYERIRILQRNYGTLTTFCPLPWFHLHVRPSGDVFPCCLLFGENAQPLGNVFDDPLSVIWRGAGFGRFRAAMAGQLRALRDDDQPTRASIDLPKPCVTPGGCFLKALPYLDDTPFAVKLDATVRSASPGRIRFPTILRPGEWARIEGDVTENPELGPSHRVEIRVNRVHIGYAVHEAELLSFGFRPDPLPDGYHLLEVIDPHGRVFDASMVEMSRR